MELEKLRCARDKFTARCTYEPISEIINHQEDPESRFAQKGLQRVVCDEPRTVSTGQDQHQSSHRK